MGDVSPGLRNNGQLLTVHLHTVGYDHVRSQYVKLSEMNHWSLSKLSYETFGVEFGWRHVEAQPDPMFGG